MIPEITILKVFASVTMLQGISSAAYSSVFVKSGADIPTDYVKYGAPPAPGAQIAQISTSVDSIVPLPPLSAVVTPCVAPCVIPASPLSAVAPLTTANAKIVTYKSPYANVPVVLANKDDASYQYAYAVYDESTGDKKTQSEKSDGSVVQGQYSFIQPDGYRREVVYTADDLKGFNAVVRNFLPESVNTKSVSKAETRDVKTDLPPCRDVKSEQLTAQPTTEMVTKDATTLEIESMEMATEKAKELTTTPATSSTANSDPNAKSVYSYNDILGCLQSKAQAKNNAGFSPLTYILIPSLRSYGSAC